MTANRTMKAVQFSEHGDADVLRYVEVPVPEPAADEVLVEVKATGVSNWDIWVRRRGFRSAPPGAGPQLPFQLGREAAGVVAAAGSEVTDFAENDPVVCMSTPACGVCELCRQGLDNLCLTARYPGMTASGGYADYVACKARDAIKVKEPASYEKLACSVWSYSTVWNQAVTCGGLQAGQSVLITGASGALGTSAIQIARFAGARLVVGSSGSADKAGQLKELGCDHAICGEPADLADAVRDVTSGRGVDLVIDCVGGPLMEAGIGALARGGTLVTVAMLGGASVTFDGGYLFREALTVKGTRGATREGQRLMAELFERGKIDPVIYRVLPLRDAAEGHRILEARQQVGRVVLVP